LDDSFSRKIRMTLFFGCMFKKFLGNRLSVDQ
jgi:hypothetical protein